MLGGETSYLEWLRNDIDENSLESKFINRRESIVNSDAIIAQEITSFKYFCCPSICDLLDKNNRQEVVRLIMLADSFCRYEWYCLQ